MRLCVLHGILPALIGLILLIWPDGRIQRQTPEPVVTGLNTTSGWINYEQPGNPPAPAAQPAQTNGTQQLYLPLIMTGPYISPIQFASELTEANLPIDPATTFLAGTVQLYATSMIDGAMDRELRFVWTLPEGREVRQLEDIDTVGFLVVNYYNRICLVIPGTNTCSGSPLPTGTYTAQIFLDGRLYQEATATVQ